MSDSVQPPHQPEPQPEPQPGPQPPYQAGPPHPPQAPESGPQPWQRFHPLTPLLRGGVVLLAVLGYVASSQLDRIFGGDSDDPTQGRWGIAAAVLALVLLAVVAGSWVSWRAASYRLGAATVELRTGVLAKQHRQVRYDRIQAVDLRRPLLAQVFGLSAVRVEAAGGANSSVELAYLTQSGAEQVRREVLARASSASGARSGPAPDRQVPEGQVWDGLSGAGAEGGLVDHPGQRFDVPDDTSAGADRLIAAIPVGRVWLATAMSFNSIVLLVSIPLLIGALITGTVGLLPIVGPMALGAAGQQFGRLSSWMNFRVETAPGLIRVRHGLTEQRTSTIPLHRIQAVQISQPALWRGLEWWRIRVNVAGVHSEAGEQSDALIPVGTRAEALAILAAMGPRWSLPEVVEGMDAPGPSPSFTAVPPAARWLDPLSWKRIGFALTPTALISRGGWLGRTVTLVPHARVQSLILEQGPIERRLGLANVRPISTVGAVVPAVRHLSLDAASCLLEQERERSGQARAGEAPNSDVSESNSPDAPTSVPAALSSKSAGSDRGEPDHGEQDGVTA